jgi:hypothetical protein
MNNRGRPKPGIVAEPTKLINLKMPVSVLEHPEIIKLKKEGKFADLIRALINAHLNNLPTN